MDETAWGNVTELDKLSAFSGFALSFEQVPKCLFYLLYVIFDPLSECHRILVPYHISAIEYECHRILVSEK